jgi:hypothetical protein
MFLSPAPLAEEAETMQAQQRSSLNGVARHRVEPFSLDLSIGALMLGQAIAHASRPVLEAAAKGEAVSIEIRRALMELAREELYRRPK